jgi:hypothetical protein
MHHGEHCYPAREYHRGMRDGSFVPSRCHALRPGAEMTVTFVLGLPGAWPYFFVGSQTLKLRITAAIALQR